MSGGLIVGLKTEGEISIWDGRVLVCWGQPKT